MVSSFLPSFRTFYYNGQGPSPGPIHHHHHHHHHHHSFNEHQMMGATYTPAAYNAQHSMYPMYDPNLIERNFGAPLHTPVNIKSQFDTFHPTLL